jgi:glycine/D-amino acid oxidase-like deaminating enzyme
MPSARPWGDPQSQPAPFSGSLSCDVVIIGSGITGTLIAYFLTQEGFSVAMFDDDWGGSATMLTTAFLIETIDTSTTELISLYGQEKAALVLESHRRAIDAYQELITNEHIECDFMRVPFYLYANTGSETKEVEEEKSALRELGVDTTDTPIPLPHAACIELPHQAKFQPLSFTRHLQEKAERQGARFYSSHIELSEDGTLSAHGGAIEAKHVVMATHYPDAQPARLFFKKARYMTFVIEYFIPKGSLPEGLYEDTEVPYHYLRVDAHGDDMRVLIGGEDRRADIKIPIEKHFEALQTYAHQILPRITRKGMQWYGPIIESGDGLAFIGQIKEDGPFYVTGHSGNGMTHAMIAAQIYIDQLQGRLNPYAELYAANRPVHIRPHMQKAVEYIEEFAGGALEDLFE